MIHTDRFEQIARIVAIAVGTLMLSMVSPDRWWALLGIAPLAMGLSGW
jgi:hypothetical protein